MGTLTAAVPINRASKTLLDDVAPSPNLLYSAPEMLDYFNASLRMLCIYKPDAFVVLDSAFVLAAGAKQTIGTRGHAFIRAPGLRQCDMDDLDHSIPGWLTVAAGPTNVVVPDRNHPRDFYVYPPATGGATIPLIYGAVPTPLTAASDTIPVDDVYEPVLYALVLAHAYAKNLLTGDVAKMNNYLNLAGQQLGLKQRMQMAAPGMMAAAQAQRAEMA